MCGRTSLRIFLRNSHFPKCKTSLRRLATLRLVTRILKYKSRSPERLACVQTWIGCGLDVLEYKSRSPERLACVQTLGVLSIPGQRAVQVSSRPAPTDGPHCANICALSGNVAPYLLGIGRSWHRFQLRANSCQLRFQLDSNLIPTRSNSFPSWHELARVGTKLARSWHI